MEFAGFDWDDGNIQKCRKHGLSVDQIEDFFRAQIWVTPDPEHSRAEDRFLAVGRGPTGRPIFVAVTLRKIEGQLLIRPISARFMHAREVRKYEEAFGENEE